MRLIGRLFSSRLNALSLIAQLLIVCAPLQAESAAELMKKGDGYDAKFQAAEALQYCPRKSWSRRMLVSWYGSRDNIVI